MPKAETWKVMLNTKQYEWGVNEKNEPMWDPNYDVVQTEVPIKKLEDTCERFTIAFDNTTGKLKLTMAWDNTLIEVPIEVNDTKKL